jgi:hypothetical protein
MIKKINTDSYIAYVFNFSIAFASVAAVIVIIIAGFEYATSGIANVKSDAKSRIENAILGLVTILCSYLILKTIDPRLVEIDTKLPEIGIDGVVFDYDGLADIANNRINQDLTDALKQVKTLQGKSSEAQQESENIQAEIASLRKQIDNSSGADAAALELKVQELSTKATHKEQEAIRLKNEANFIGSEASIKASYDSGKVYLEQLTDNSANSTERKIGLDEKIKSINSVSDRAIRKAVGNGDTDGASKLTELKAFYTTKLQQDDSIDQNTKLYADQIEYIKNNYVGSTDPEFKKAFQKKIEDSIKKLDSAKYPDNISNEHKLSLQEEKAAAIKNFEALIKTIPQ